MWPGFGSKLRASDSGNIRKYAMEEESLQSTSKGQAHELQQVLSLAPQILLPLQGNPSLTVQTVKAGFALKP